MGRKMEKEKLKPFLILVLTLTLLIGCAQPNSASNAENNPPLAKSEKSNQKNGDIQSSFYTFKTSFEKFPGSIKQIKSSDLSSVKPVYERLQKMRSSYKTFHDNAKNNQNFNPPEYLSSIDNIIAETEQLVQKFTDQSSVPEGQDELVKNRHLNAIDLQGGGRGNFGDRTSTGLIKYLEDQNEQLSPKIIDLESIINQSLKSNSVNSSSPIIKEPSPPPKAANAQNNESDNLASQKPQNSSLLVFFINVVVLILAAALLISILYLFRQVSVLEVRILKNDDRKRSAEANQRNQENSQQTLERKVQELTQRVNQLVTQLNSLEGQLSSGKSYSSQGNYSNNPSTYSATRRTPETPVNQSYAPPYSQLVATYNSDPSSFSRNGIKVSETDESISRRRSDSNQPVVLGKESSGNYWVIAGGGSTEWLVPKSNLSLDPYNLETVYSLFTCHGRPESSNKLTLIKPARVSRIREEWQVEEPGELQFS